MLRERGQSYSAVARALGLKRAMNAQEAFVRAMRSLPEPERKALGRRESQRLDELEARIRSRDANDPAKMERHLVALDALRQSIL
jgi:cytidylate kinase